MKYMQDAQRRTRRRKSKWNLLVLLSTIFFLLIILFSFLKGVEGIHIMKYPDQRLSSNPQGMWVLVSMLPLLFAAMPPSFLCANLVCWLIPPARLALDSEAKLLPSTKFIEAQKGLLKLMCGLTSVSLAVSVYGAFHSWCAKCA